MGKSKKVKAGDATLGRSLIRQQRHHNRASRSTEGDSWRHTSELQDGYDWGRLNLQSVTEQSNLEDFLTTAEMAGVEFTAEKLNIKVVTPDTITGVLGEDERKRVKKLQDENRQFVTIPRRPAWNRKTSPEQLELNEKDAFLNWRRSLALLQEEKDLMLTPYEKNLNVWRQLWRVIERSDVVCQIVDARNPLLFKCDDLEVYVKEVDPKKKFMLLINKADYLTSQQRVYWASYFTEQKTKVIFWSALEETEIHSSKVADDPGVPDEELENLRIDRLQADLGFSDSEASTDEDQPPESKAESSAAVHEPPASECAKATICATDSKGEDFAHVDVENSAELISGAELIRYFKNCTKSQSNRKRPYVTIGLVGYPNVGKSSTINALLCSKKVAVSATPGKTKHFQTLFLDKELQLCDCPGLVFPTFISTKAELVLNGILPIDQLKDYVAPVTRLAQLIPRDIIENTYGMNIPRPKEGEDPKRPPTAEEVLSSYGSMRGYMTHSGLPDCPRSSRYILKDFVKGKLLFCLPPPGITEEQFEPTRLSLEAAKKWIARAKREESAKLANLATISVIDDEFFAESAAGAHMKLPSGVVGMATRTQQDGTYKPWKKHGNKNKKEKLRRIYKAK